MARVKALQGAGNTGIRPLYRIHSGPQQLFMTTDAEEVLYGGAAGGGKSLALRALAVDYCLRYPGAVVVLFRRTFRELEDTHILELQKELPKEVATYKSSSHDFVFYNGSIIMCRFCEKEQDVYSYDTFQADMMLFDELTAFSSFQYVYLTSRCRSTKPWWPGPRIRSCTNPGNVGHCLSEGEVLTPQGWKDISLVQPGDTVMTLDEKEHIVPVVVDHTCSHDYDGDLTVSDGDTAYISCTPYHKIARRTETKTPFGRTFNGIKLTEAASLPQVSRLIRAGTWVDGERISSFSVDDVSSRVPKLSQPLTVDGDAFCSLMGWFLSEGYTVDRDKCFGVAQMKEHNRATIRDLLETSGFKYRTSPSGFTVYSASWWKYLQQFGKSRDKFVPREIMSAPAEQLRLFFDAAMAGDGCGRIYYTTSKTLAEQMQIIGLKLGYSPRLSSRQRENRDGLSYEVSFRKGRDGYLVKSSFRNVPYKGKVYCLGIDGLHRFFVRQRGTVWLSGNSWVKQRWIDYLEPVEIKRGPDNEGGFTRQFIPAKLSDNETLMEMDPGYINRLRALPDEQYRAKALGDWSVFSGQYFQRYRPSVHECEPFTIPADWKRIATYDYGTAAPHAVLWLASPPLTNHVWVYREQYGAGLPPREQARRARQSTTAFDEKLDFVVGDPSIWAKEKDRDGNMMTSIADIWIEEFQGLCEVVRGNNERIQGWSLVREMLDWQGIETPTGINVVVPPRLHIFTSCKNLIRTLPGLLHDEGNVEDVDTKGEDHAPDALRYGVRHLFQAPQQEKRVRYVDTGGSRGIIVVPA